MNTYMSNIDRLKMEIRGIDFPENELEVYLMENDLDAHLEYNVSNKKKILQTALSILESVANDVNLMKNYKLDDMTVLQFHENLMNRIDQLERKLRNMADNKENDSSFFMLFSK